MAAASEQVLIEKLRSLPPERLAEAEDFVDSLRARENRSAAFEAFLAIAGRVEQAGIAPMSEAQIEAELAAARSLRREQRAKA